MIQINNVNNNSSSNASNSSSTSSSSSRLAAQLSRVANINLALAKQQQQLQQQQQQDGATATSGGNLSPHIMLNVGSSGPLLTTTTSINNATAIRRPSTTKSPPPPVEVVAANVADDAGVKVAARFGDYVFYELANATETFGTAVNEKTKALFNWKKFERRDYMKKLEPYMVMDGACEQIYRFSEIIFSSNYAAQGSVSSGSENSNNSNDDVYVLFEPHYGDLHSFMKEKKRLEENEARLIFRQCVEAVQSCHDNGIIIRDIKLKKFVFLDEQRTKIGLANLEDCLLLEEDAENDLIKSQQGCPAYVSPEVLNPIQTSYSGKLSDAWSLGIILYTLLVGRYPFHHPTIANMFARIARGKFQVPLSVSLSLDARILLRSLIRVKPDERLLPHEILAHNWFRHHNETSLSAATSTPIHLNHCQQAKNSTNIHLNLAANNHHRSATVPALIDQSGDDACVPTLPITN